MTMSKTPSRYNERHVHYSTYSTAAIRQWLTVAVQTDRTLENSKISIVKWYDVHHFLVGKIYEYSYTHHVLRERKKEREREREREAHTYTERQRENNTRAHRLVRGCSYTQFIKEWSIPIVNLSTDM